MFRISLLLLFLSGCADRSTHRDQVVTASSGALTPGQLSTGEPALTGRVRVSTATADNSGAHTMTWSDSGRRGDTTFFGQGRVVTTTEVYLDSQWMRMPERRLLPGIPVGLFDGWDGITLRPNSEVFTLTYGSETPATLLTRLALARSRGFKMVVAMSGGRRANYLTDGVFDMAKWRARMEAYNTPAIRAAVAQAVADGILLGNSVMDEPFNEGGPGNESNSWGPKGTMSKARVDSMCGYAKSIFPTLPQGVFQDYRLAPDDSYMVCDFVTSQYRIAKGPLTEYRDGALALCRRDHHACSFAINVLDGGNPVRRQPGQIDYLSADCPLTTTGGRGTYFPNCRMTAEQVREAGRLLGSAGCFLTGFRYDAGFMAKPENQQAFRDVVATLATQGARSCIRM